MIMPLFISLVDMLAGCIDCCQCSIFVLIPHHYDYHTVIKSRLSLGKTFQMFDCAGLMTI